jgi:hypothetical protein
MGAVCGSTCSRKTPRCRSSRRSGLLGGVRRDCGKSRTENESRSASARREEGLHLPEADQLPSLRQACDLRSVSGPRPGGRGVSAKKLTQREPGPVAIQKGLDSLIAGLNARDLGRRWRISSPPDRLKGTGSVRTGDVDRPGIVRPDHQDAVGNLSTAGTAAHQDRPDHPGEQVA